MFGRSLSLLVPFAAGLALALPGTASAATCTNTDALPGTATFEATAVDTTLCLLNNERAAQGLGTLRHGPSELSGPATNHARDMVARQYFSHDTPEGGTLSERLAAYTNAGSSWSIGENLAWGESDLGTPAAIVKAWMNSPGHRRNILDASFKEIGIAIVPGAPSRVSRPAATYATEFGSRSLPSTSPATVVDDTPAGTAGKAARSTTTAKKAKKAKRCRKVTRRVRRNGRMVKVKKTVCTRKSTASARRRSR